MRAVLRALFLFALSGSSWGYYTCHDLTSGESCANTDIHCVGPAQEYPGTQAGFSAATAAAGPGDAVCIEPGTYDFAGLSGGLLYLGVGAGDGTAAEPKHAGPMPGGMVIFQGYGSAQAWNDLGIDQIPPNSDSEIGVIIGGDYWVLDGDSRFVIQYAAYGAVNICGDHNTVREVEARGGFYYGVFLGDSEGCPDEDDLSADYNTIEYNYLTLSQHNSGIDVFVRSSAGNRIDHAIWRRNLISWNGWTPDKLWVVPSIPGDGGSYNVGCQQYTTEGAGECGGGNADALAVSKFCPDYGYLQGVDNLCSDYQMIGNIAWRTADDCYDFSPGSPTIFADNYCEHPGPQGNRFQKNLGGRILAGDVHTYFGNIGNYTESNGFDARPFNTLRSVNNLGTGAVNNTAIVYNYESADSTSVVANNLAYDNVGDFMGIPAAPATVVGNWGENADGDPGMRAGARGFELDTAIMDDANATIPEKWADLRAQLERQFMPAAGSPLIDAGTYVAGVHCARGDDDPADPYPPDDELCQHWSGAAPDIGAIEYRRVLPGHRAPTVRAHASSLYEGYGHAAHQNVWDQGPDTCTVTNTSDSGAGSLRDCVTNRTGARIVEFDPSLAGQTITTSGMNIADPYLIIDGSGVGGTGVTLKNATTADNVFSIVDHDVVLEHLRFEGHWDETTEPDTGGGFIVVDGDAGGGAVHDVMLSRLTVLRSQDSGIDIWCEATDVTVQWSLLAKNLHPSTISCADDTRPRQRISLHHNVYYENDQRSPQLRRDVRDVDIRNHLVIDHSKIAASNLGGGYGIRLRAGAAVHPTGVNIVKSFFASAYEPGNALDLDPAPWPYGSDAHQAGNAWPSEEDQQGQLTASEFAVPAAEQVTEYPLADLATEVLARVGYELRTAEENTIVSAVQAALSAEGY